MTVNCGAGEYTYIAYPARLGALTSIIIGGFEAVADSAKKIGETVSPGALIESAVGVKKSDEYSEYLKNLGDKNLIGENLEKKKQELASKDEDEKNKMRSFLQATPAHMRLPQKPQEPRPQEEVIQDEERKKAMQVEAQKKQAQTVVTPIGKHARGALGAKKRPKTSMTMESSKNIKVG